MSESESFEYPTLDRLTVGTVGEPGQRLFFLQARRGDQVATVKLEKLQVAGLATLIAKTLEDLPAVGTLPEDLEPEPFLEPAWVVGTLGIAYDPERDRMVLMAAEVNETDDSEPDLFGHDGGAVAHFGASREQMAALAIRATMLVSAGRPPCPFCGYPLDQSGHSCPRSNGHRPPPTP